MPGHYGGGGSSSSQGPAGGASSGGTYGGDSSGGYSDQERGASQAATKDTYDEYRTIVAHSSCVSTGVGACAAPLS